MPCLVLILYFFAAVKGALVEEACEVNVDCTPDNSECSSVPTGCTRGLCQCSDGFAWDGTTCNPKVQFGELCTHESQCPGGEYPDQSMIYFQGSCDGLDNAGNCPANVNCVCGCEDRGSAEWQITSDRTACEWAIKKRIGEACATNNDCYFYSQKTATCDNNVCACIDDSYWSGTSCIYKGRGEVCAQDNDCIIETFCTGGRCQCDPADLEIDLPVERCEFDECKFPDATPSCIHPDGLFYLGPGSECNVKLAGTTNRIFDATAAYCNPGLTCGQCPEGGNNVCYSDSTETTTTETPTASETKFWMTTEGMAVICSASALLVMALCLLLFFWCCWITNKTRLHNRELGKIGRKREQEAEMERKIAQDRTDRSNKKVAESASVQTPSYYSPARYQTPQIPQMMFPAQRSHGYVVASPPPQYSAHPPPTTLLVVAPMEEEMDERDERPRHKPIRKKMREKIQKKQVSVEPMKQELDVEPQPTWEVGNTRNLDW